MTEEVQETMEQFESYLEFVFPQIHSHFVNGNEIEVECGIHTHGGIEQWLTFTVPVDATLEQFAKVVAKHCFNYDMECVNEDFELHYESQNFRDHFTAPEAYAEFKAYHLFLRSVGLVFEEAVNSNTSKTDEELSVKLVGGLMEISNNGIPNLIFPEFDQSILIEYEMRIAKMTFELSRFINRIRNLKGNEQPDIKDVMSIATLQAGLSEFLKAGEMLPTLDPMISPHDINRLCESGRKIITNYLGGEGNELQI